MSPQSDAGSCREGRRSDGVDGEEAATDHRAAIDHVGAQAGREVAGRFVGVDQCVD